MTSPNGPVGPGPQRPVHPGPSSAMHPGVPPVQPSPHGVGYTTQVPPPSQVTPPQQPSPGPVPGPPYGPSGPHQPPSAAPRPQPSAGPQPQPSAPAPQANAASSTLLDLGVTRRTPVALARRLYPLSLAAGLVLWAGPVAAAFATAAAFDTLAFAVLGMLALVLGWLPGLVLAGLTRLVCETWLDSTHG